MMNRPRSNTNIENVSSTKLLFYVRYPIKNLKEETKIVLVTKWLIYSSFKQIVVWPAEGCHL